MTRVELLLIQLMEECDEVSQRVSKALRFGLEDIDPNTGKTALASISHELSDMFGVIEYLNEEGVRIDERNRVAIDKKKCRIKEYVKYSEKVGILKESK